MHVHNRGMSIVARRIVWHVHQSRDLPLRVAARVTHEEGLNHIFHSQSSEQ